MATQRINRRTDLVDTQSVSFIRQMKLAIKATDCKPNVRLYPFFDGQRVDSLVWPNDAFGNPLPNGSGAPCVTDATGSFSGSLFIPGFRFTTGTKTLFLSESTSIADTRLLGSTTGSATAQFISTGVKQIFQETVNTTNTVTTENVIRREVVTFIEEPAPPIVIPTPVPTPSLSPTPTPTPTPTPAEVIDTFIFSSPGDTGGDGGSDPVAQSFDTYGQIGGRFITALDLYFNTKDEILPVIVELREMINGYPGPRLLNPYSRVSLPSSLVATSTDASLPTRFYFPKMVYLVEDKEYCFVILANTNKYNIFTAILSERSIETGAIVFEQVHLGSIFKSQNNSTWTADQFEDVKFTLYAAKFDNSSTAVIPISGSATPIVTSSRALATKADSNIISCRLPFKHGFDVGSHVQIELDVTGTYNGITGSDIMGPTLNKGSWVVSSVMDEYSFKFNVQGNATSTGEIITNGLVQCIYVDNGGSGYSSITPPTVVITGGGGSGATAVATVLDGKVAFINVINKGTGYTSAPIISLSSNIGTGSTAQADLEFKFSMAINRFAHEINPSISNFIPDGTKISAKLDTKLGNYPGGNITNYSNGNSIEFDINNTKKLNQNVLICSRVNENYKLSNSRSSTINLTLQSNNPNVSPVIDLEQAKIMFSNNTINNQLTDTKKAVAAFGSVESISLSSFGGGAGYTGPITIEIQAIPGDLGTGAKATAIAVGGVINSIITVDNGGYGYTTPPKVIISAPQGTAGVQAYATAKLTEFNTELSHNQGRSRARYVTKPQTLETISNGARIIVSAYSSENTGVDVYIRTTSSAAGLVHQEQNWIQMKCDVNRNTSTTVDQFYDYDFYLNDIVPFDVFDIKIVLTSTVPHDAPIIKNYRAIMIT